jgi:hypothetical protein
MSSLKLFLRTDDKELIKALRDIKDDNFKMSVYTVDQLPGIEPTISAFLLTISGILIAQLVLKILEQIVTKKPREDSQVGRIEAKTNIPQMIILIKIHIDKEKKEGNDNKK